MFVKTSLRDRLICFADFVGMTLLAVLLRLPPSLPPKAPFRLWLPSPNCLLKSLSSHTLCSCLDILPTTNTLCNFWHSKIQQVSTYAFCSWDDLFTQKWNCSSPKNLCKCTESSSKLSTNTSIEWNLYLS